MNVIFWLVTGCAIVTALYQSFVRKNIFGISTYILLGVYAPLLLSFADWSTYHVADKGGMFYYVLTLFGVMFSIVNIIPQRKMQFVDFRFAYKSKIYPIELINIGYILCILLENYYMSGFFIPSMFGIDIHTMRMPYIYFITTGIYIVAVMDVIEFLITKRKRYLLYMVLAIATNVITKSARVDAVICAVQILSLTVFYLLTKQDVIRQNQKPIRKKKKSLGKLVVIACVAVLVVMIALNVGNNRMNHFGKYDLSYADMIQYHGPELGGEILPYYYGYFALSFDNLAYNLKNTEIDFNILGLSTFRTLWFGIMQFDNIFGLNGGAATQANMIRNRAAAIATGFWDMYYDYGLLIFIPFFISFAIYFWIRQRVTKNGHITVQNLIIYFYWIPLWFVLSFDNRIYDYQVMIHIIILYVLIKNRYVMTTEKEMVQTSKKLRRRIRFKRH